MNENDFKLERYKYILKQIHFLNENTYTYLTFFQRLAVLILGAILALFLNWRKFGVDADTALLGVYGLLFLLVLFALFVVLYMLTGVVSWFDYRKEEVKLLDEVIGLGYRSKPTLKNWWRWRETWLIFSILVFVTIVLWSVLTFITPIMLMV